MALSQSRNLCIICARKPISRSAVARTVVLPAIIIASLVVSAIALSAWYTASNSDGWFVQENTSRIVLLAASLATLGWSIRSLVQIDSDRKRQTADLVSKIIFDPRYEKAMSVISSEIAINGIPSITDMEKYIGDAPNDENDFSFVRSVALVANRFEVLFVALENDYVYDDMIQEYLRDIFSWFFPVVEPIAIISREKHVDAYRTIENYCAIHLNMKRFGHSNEFKIRNET